MTMARTLVWTLIVGLGATVCMDLWALARRRLLGTPLPNYGFVGRWCAHLVRGRFRHDSIAAASPVPGEALIGWTAHYAIGVAFAGLLVASCGVGWLQTPTVGPALAVGIATVAAPMLILQPGMGAGIAARRTARPNAARLQSVVTHAVFGAGLYVAGCVARALLAP
jgi:hypothetical protein